MGLKRKQIGAICLIIIILISSGTFFLFNNSNNSANEETITIDQKGSDTMLELCLVWAEAYQSAQSDVVINVTGGGSAVGLGYLIAGNITIAQSSRAITAQEMQKAEANGLSISEYKVAIDGIAIIVPTSNSLTNLTIDQLRAIFNGSISNWDELGLKSGHINLYGRQNTSGTYAYFLEHILSGTGYSSNMSELAGNQAIVNAVMNDPNGIGYVGIGYVKGISGINILNLRNDTSSPEYSPTNESEVVSMHYPLARYLYFYTAETQSVEVKDYIKWIIGSEGQELAVSTGFYALPQSDVDKDLALLD